MVRRNGTATIVVNRTRDGVSDCHRSFDNFANMQNKRTVVLYVNDLDSGATRFDCTNVKGLAAGFCIETGLVQDDTDGGRFLGDRVDKTDSVFGFAAADKEGLDSASIERCIPDVLGTVVSSWNSFADQIRSLFSDHAHVLSRATCHFGQASLFTEFLFFLHFGFKAVLIDGHAFFFGHEFGQINRESHGSVQKVSFCTGEDLVVADRLGHFIEFLQSLVQSSREGFFLVSNNFGDKVLFLLDFGEVSSHDFDQLGHQLAEKSQGSLKILTTVSDGTTQDTSQDVSSSIVGRQGAVGNGKGQRTNVIGNDTVRHILVADIFGTQSAGVRLWVAGQLLDFFKERHEDIGIVVGIDTLQDASKTFETHTGIDVLGGERSKRSIGLTIELNENVVPDFNDIWQIGVDQFGGVASSNTIVVDFRTRTAGPRGTHLPKVILGAKGQDLFGRKILQPNVSAFEIGRRLVVAPKVRGVETGLVHFELFREAFPSHGDGFLLEVVAKTPVSQHLKEGVMVRVLPDIVEIVVLSTGADAFLGVGRTFQGRHGEVGITRSQEQGLVLVHSSVGEEQRWIINGNARAGLPKGMAVLLDKELDKGAADLVHGPLGVGISHRVGLFYYYLSCLVVRSRR
mmetsp:Transcript_9357/g.15007  ORF Transcript_9357/g.15007 Transcript_9357/m.15007 type:complete len:626 (+) Transcript_9357:1284-3161(+)